MTPAKMDHNSSMFSDPKLWLKLRDFEMGLSENVVYPIVPNGFADFSTNPVFEECLRCAGDPLLRLSGLEDI